MSETEMNAEDNFNITDDLLDELDKLDSSTEVMEEEVKRVTDNQNVLAETDSHNSIDAATISLESAKTAQLAAEQSQNATEAAVKLSHEQKKQAMDLADSNVAWRQSVRNINKELDTAKNTVTIMMVIVIVISVITISVMGFLFYSVQKKNDQLKGEVLDVLSTQSSLLNKQMTLKTDQMASVVDSIMTSIQAKPVHRVQPEPTASSTPEPAIVAPAPAQTQAAAPSPQQLANTTVTAEIGPELKAQIAQLTDAQQKQMAKVNELLEQMAKQQKTETASVDKVTTNAKIKTAPIEVTAVGLTESQLKKLNRILWRVSEQSVLLKQIQETLKKSQAQPLPKTSAKDNTANTAQNGLNEIKSSLNSLSQQLESLKTNQAVLKTQIEEVKKETAQTQENAVPQSGYQFQAPAAVQSVPQAVPNPTSKPYSFKAQ